MIFAIPTHCLNTTDINKYVFRKPVRWFLLEAMLKEPLWLRETASRETQRSLFPLRLARAPIAFLPSPDCLIISDDPVSGDVAGVCGGLKLPTLDYLSGQIQEQGSKRPIYCLVY